MEVFVPQEELTSNNSVTVDELNHVHIGDFEMYYIDQTVDGIKSNPCCLFENGEFIDDFYNMAHAIAYCISRQDK